MAFRELTQAPKGMGGGAGPRVTAAISRRKNAVRGTLVLGINADALEQAGLKIGGRARLLLGEGDQAQQLRVEAAKDGPFELKGFGGPHKSKRPGCILRISDAAFVAEARDKRRVEWSILADPHAPRPSNAKAEVLGIELTLPRSFFPQPVLTVTTAGPPAPRSATAAVMGDPAPGRSALARR